MVRITFHDNADEFRVEIDGRFADGSVDDVLYLWKSVVKDGSRGFTVDITQLTGYDYAGWSLLVDMHKYGAQFAAGSATSLVFLNEVSTARPQSLEAPLAKSKRVHSKRTTSVSLPAAAAVGK